MTNSVLVMLGAGRYSEFPVCEAVTEQAPAADAWSVAVSTRQEPVAMNATGQDEEALAESGVPAVG